MPTCWIIAGPNGAGKTTFALEYLPQIANCRNFINADLIASGLAPLAPSTELSTASRLFLKEIKTGVQVRKDFAFETTLSGRSYLKLIRQLQIESWEVQLVYLALSSVELSKLRVAERVAHGGHDIPLVDIERRFPKSLRNLLTLFSHEASRTRCFLNDDEEPKLVFEQMGKERLIYDKDTFELLETRSKS